jgi:hypothetical protein
LEKTIKTHLAANGIATTTVHFVALQGTGGIPLEKEEHTRIHLTSR